MKEFEEQNERFTYSNSKKFWPHMLHLLKIIFLALMQIFSVRLASV